MSTLVEIEAAVKILSRSEQEELRAFITGLIKQSSESARVAEDPLDTIIGAFSGKREVTGRKAEEILYGIEAAAEALSPAQLRQLLAHLTVRLEHGSGEKEKSSHAYEVLTGADGLPLVRGDGGIITSEMVREIEGQAR